MARYLLLFQVCAGEFTHVLIPKDSTLCIHRGHEQADKFLLHRINRVGEMQLAEIIVPSGTRANHF